MFAAMCACASAQSLLLEPVTPGEQDSNMLSGDLKLQRPDLRVPTGFERVYRVGGDVSHYGFPQGTELYARVNNGVVAVFPRSEYVQTRIGAMPVIPAGTRWLIGAPTTLVEPGTLDKPKSEVHSSSTAPILTPIMPIDQSSAALATATGRKQSLPAGVRTNERTNLVVDRRIDTTPTTAQTPHPPQPPQNLQPSSTTNGNITSKAAERTKAQSQEREIATKVRPPKQPPINAPSLSLGSVFESEQARQMRVAARLDEAAIAP